MNAIHSLRHAASSIATAAAILFSTIGAVDADVVSGFLNDPGNAALIASDGYQNLEAARFGNDDEIVRNVAVYELTVVAGGNMAFVSSGNASGGAEPYFSLFSGTGIAATFVGSNLFDPLVDFNFLAPLGPGQYLFSIGVWLNMSFAENNPDSDPTIGDGFTALGDPTRLGDTFYDVDVSSNDGATFRIAPATGLIGPPHPAPEPATVLLVFAALLVLANVPRGTRTARAAALHAAAYRSRRDVAELLILNGAKVNASSVNGFTPIHKALERIASLRQLG